MQQEVLPISVHSLWGARLFDIKFARDTQRLLVFSQLRVLECTLTIHDDLCYFLSSKPSTPVLGPIDRLLRFWSFLKTRD